jgi:pantoate--beta-alanine ligase
VAVFGKKDFQQLLVLRRMVEQFALPIDVQAGQTWRTASGLALSSRNAYLSADERVRAIELPQAIAALARAYRAGAAPLAELESKALQAMTDTGWRPDYLTVRRGSDLQPPGAGGATGAGDGPLVALGAARLGATRLIDNLEF